MNYLSVRQAAEKWEMTPRRVQILCNEGRIEGAQRVGNVWTIPENAEKPIDARKHIEPKNKRVNSSIRIDRIWAMPNKNTFDVKPINDLIIEELTEGLWIDPFANKNKLATVTNDLNTEFDTDYHMDALDFMKMFNSSSVDGVLYDPPYSPRQVSECYNNVGLDVTWDTTKASFWGNHKREISRIVKLGGKVITFGWNSGGIGYKYGFEIERVLLVPHGGWHNDTICTVERKTHEGNFSNEVEKNAMKTSSILKRPSSTDKKIVDMLESCPEGFWDFKNEDTRVLTHGIHSYPAMMVCPISRNIIRMVKEVMPISTLFDPFCGSGTVVVEGILANVPHVYGNDINPLALFLSKVKTTPLDVNVLQSEVLNLYARIHDEISNLDGFISNADQYMREALGLDLTAKDGWGSNATHYLNEYAKANNVQFLAPNFKNVGYWFKPQVIICLQIIKTQIEAIQNDDIRDFALVAFSETIRLVSNRRNGEFKMFRMPPSKVEIFEPNVFKEFSIILNRNIEKMNSFVEICDEVGANSSVQILSNNATKLDDMPDGTVDLVITSPPYGDSRTTVAYGEYSRLSLQWLGLNDLSEKEILGIDKSLMGGTKYRNGFEYSIPSETLRISLDRIKDVDIERAGDVYSFYSDLNASISEISKKMKMGGYQFWVVGNRTVKGELLKTDIIVSEIAAHYGLQHIYTINRNIVNKVMPSLNSPTNEIGIKSETMSNEHIVVLKKV